MKKIGKILCLFILLLSTCACSKNRILKTYEVVTERVGDLVLTNHFKLKGTRHFGDNHYIGEYDALYEDFNGKEILFGGTSIDPEIKNIHVKIYVYDSKGSLKIYYQLPDEENVLVTEDGSYDYSIPIAYGSCYLVVEGEDYSGQVDIEVEEDM